MSQITQLDRLIAEEPFVRTLAQSLLADEADEVVQQTYMRALKHSGEAIEQPRSWLATVVRNVASNLQRDQKRRLDRERDARAQTLAPSSDELMVREEQRQRLVAAIDALPSNLRTVLLLRFYEGLAPRHIAQKTGLSNDVVRNRIRRALQLLRERLDADHNGDRRAWMLALIPIACPSAAQAAKTTATTTSITAATAAILSVAVGALWWSWPADPPPATDTLAAVADDTDVDAAVAQRGPARAVVPETVREPVTPEEDGVTAGTLDVILLHSDGQTPAVGTALYVHHNGNDQRAPLRQKVCDATGTCSFANLPAGEIWISNDRGTHPLVTTIVAGEHRVVQHVLDGGVTLTGIVVDDDGKPVPGARIEGSPLSSATTDAMQLGTADANGRFEILDVSRRAVVGARAPGRMPGMMLSVHGKIGTTIDLRLTVGPPGCNVTGVVRNENGRPVPHASIAIGGGRSSGLRVFGSVHPPMPSLTKSDAKGRFRAIGVPAGKLPVVVIARDRAPWFGMCETHHDATNDLQISMLPPATIEGVVLTNDGSPAVGAIVEIHAIHRFDFQQTRCDEEGRYRLTRVGPGITPLRAHLPGVGGAMADVETKANETMHLDLQLDDGPPPGSGPRRPGQQRGPLPNLAPSREKPPMVPAIGPQPMPQPGFDVDRDGEAPARDEHGKTERRGRKKRHRGTGAIVGRIVAPDGTPLENASVFAEYRGKGVRGNVERLTGNDGGFELPHLADGKWRIDVFPHGRPAFSLEEIDLRDGERRQLAASTAPAGGRLRILLPLDYPQNTRIRLRPRPTFRRIAVHHVNGGRETDFLPAGEYEMTVRNHNVELLRQKVTVVADRVSVVSLR